MYYFIKDYIRYNIYLDFNNEQNLYNFLYMFVYRCSYKYLYSFEDKYLGN